MRRLPQLSTLFPYTTLFRSVVVERPRGEVGAPHDVADGRGPVAEVGEHLARGVEDGRAVGLQHRSEEHTSELQSPMYLVCRLLLEKKKISNLSCFISSRYSF